MGVFPGFPSKFKCRLNTHSFSLIGWGFQFMNVCAISISTPSISSFSLSAPKHSVCHQKPWRSNQKPAPGFLYIHSYVFIRSGNNHIIFYLLIFLVLCQFNSAMAVWGIQFTLNAIPRFFVNQLHKKRHFINVYSTASNVLYCIIVNMLCQIMFNVMRHLITLVTFLLLFPFLCPFFGRTIEVQLAMLVSYWCTVSYFPLVTGELEISTWGSKASLSVIPVLHYYVNETSMGHLPHRYC